MAESLKYHLLSARGPESGCVIVLHGRGTTGSDLIPVAEAADLPGVRWVFPDAPFPFPGVWGGRMWFGPLSGDAEGIAESRRLLFDLIAAVRRDRSLAPGRIGLFGFSQGAVMALDVVTRLPERLGAVVAFSGFLAHAEALRPAPSPESSKTPILLAHGTEDEIVSVDGSRRAREALAEAGYPVSLREFPIGHEIVPEEIALLRSHFSKHLCGERPG